MKINFDIYGEIWFVDVENTPVDGNPPTPLCMVFKGLKSGREIATTDIHELWVAPYRENDIVVSFHAQDAVAAFIQLGWTTPCNIIDLFAEHRILTNGKQPLNGDGLYGVCAWYGIEPYAPLRKEGNEVLLRNLSSAGELLRQDLLYGCRCAIECYEKIFYAIREELTEYSLLRGLYAIPLAEMYINGVPVDVELIERINLRWEKIADALIKNYDFYGFFADRKFKRHRLQAYVNEYGIDWPRTKQGLLAIDDETFKEMALIYPALEDIRQLIKLLMHSKKLEFPVGKDDRTRGPLHPYASKTGRNQPKTKTFIMNSAVALRSLVKPAPGRSIAYIDISRAEFGEAAYLSNDPKMIEAYESDDAYLTFAEMAGALPTGVSKEDRIKIREVFKTVALALQYSMGKKGLSRKLEIPEEEAQNLIDMHKRTFKRFWQWSDGAVAYAKLIRKTPTTFDWRIHILPETKETTIRNFHLQANGAEILRIACINCSDAGIKLLVPMHDAILIEGKTDNIENAVKIAERCIQEASEIVLGKGRLKTESKIINHPDRFIDDRGIEIWTTIMKYLDLAEMEATLFNPDCKTVNLE